MKKTLLIFSILSISFLFSCKKQVTSCIDLEGYTFNTGTVVTFTSCSKNELSYDWRMTGPVGAPENLIGWSDKVITNNFTLPGAYTITLNTYSKFSLLGDNATTTLDFTVN